MKPSALPFLLLTAVICFSGDSLTFADTSPTEFVRNACNATSFPTVCEQCLSSYAPTVRGSKRQLAQAALAVSADRVSSASALVSRILARVEKSLRSQEAGAVQDCVESMRNGVDRLRSSAREIARMGRARSSRFAWHLSNVQAWVSAALTDETTCLDGLAQFAGPAVRSAIKKKVVEVAQVTSIALALVNQIEGEN